MEQATTTAAYPAGPRGGWLRGCLPEFRRDVLGFYTHCAREYGDFVPFRLGPKRLVLLSHPDAIEQVLATQNKNFRKNYILRLLLPLIGNGILSSDGDFWLRQRRMMQPAFARQRVADYAPVMLDYTQRMLSEWRSGAEIDMHQEMMRLTLRIAAKTLFDADADDAAGDVGEALEVVADHFLHRLDSLMPAPLFVPTPGNLRLKRSIRRLDAIIYRFIAERRASKSERGDLLSILLNAQDEDGSRMTDRQLRDEAMTLFLAGHETTAITLSWTCALIAQHPPAEAKLRAELADVLAGRPPTIEDIPRLSFLEGVLQESLRLYPPAFTLGREAIDDCEISGYRMPLGTTVVMSPWVVHRDPRWWDGPAQFRPERWKEPGVKELPRFAYFPFGGGPHLCIGQPFAMLEAALVMAAILQRYRFELLEPPVIRRPAVTLRPTFGVRMRIEAIPS